MSADQGYVRALGQNGGGSDILSAGGKAANLSRLIHAGFPVPGGFFLTAQAYREATDPLEPELRRVLSSGSAAAASSAIGALVLGAGLPRGAREEVLAEYGRMGTGDRPPVAVRSSATAEDLPDLSFAGQQDSYLGIEGEEALLDAIGRCWASLWSERAIEYRRRAGLEGELPSIAVIVQEMAHADSAGVLFTVDPVGGCRGRVAIEAVRGLGDVLVSGKANPERYAVLRGAGDTLRLAPPEASPPPGSPILTESEILELARLGVAVEESFGSPQDIEWARSAGSFVLLQSRPITSLYPLPEDGRPASFLYSFGSWQGYLEPFTPMGRESMLGIVAGASRLFGLRVSTADQRSFREAGERLWVELGPLFGRELGRRFAALFMGAIDPPGAAIIAVLDAEGSLPVPRRRLPLSVVLGLLRFFPKVLFRVARNIARPAAGRDRLAKCIEQASVRTEAQIAVAGHGAALARTVAGLAERLGPSLLPELLGGMVSSQVPYQLLLRLAAQAGAGQEAIELSRALPHNVTTEMDLELWRVARVIRADRASHEACTALGATGLARAFLAGELPSVAAEALGGFLSRYGFRGRGEIDLGMPRWREDPAGPASALLSYLAIEDEASSPETLFARGAARAARAAVEVEAAIRRARGPLGATLARFLIGRLRELGGLRESPKFGIMRVLDVLRRALLAEGSRLVASGALEAPADIFFLRTAELAALTPQGGPLPDARGLVAHRKALRAREARRRRIPRLIAGDGRVWFDPPADETGGKAILRGSPVSPGLAEGRARIVFDPARASLEPGDILVCPATDPAWTPLFLATGALVTEVGGAMTHGSVVAREYGIPAVVGLARATELIPEGARIRVDGSGGTVTLL